MLSCAQANKMTRLKFEFKIWKWVNNFSFSILKFAVQYAVKRCTMHYLYILRRHTQVSSPTLYWLLRRNQLAEAIDGFPGGMESGPGSVPEEGQTAHLSRRRPPNHNVTNYRKTLRKRASLWNELSTGFSQLLQRNSARVQRQQNKKFEFAVLINVDFKSTFDTVEWTHAVNNLLNGAEASLVHPNQSNHILRRPLQMNHKNTRSRQVRRSGTSAKMTCSQTFSSPQSRP